MARCEVLTVEEGLELFDAIPFLWRESDFPRLFEKSLPTEVYFVPAKFDFGMYEICFLGTRLCFLDHSDVVLASGYGIVHKHAVNIGAGVES